MPQLKLYIASTIDGYIADSNGQIDWLNELPNPTQDDFGYTEFIESIDTIIMGRKTYETVVGFDIEWPYKHQKTYVVSKAKKLDISTPSTFHLHKVDMDSIDSIKLNAKKDIWIVGGGLLIKSFIELNQVDTMVISLVPQLIGRGIRLFPVNDKLIKFKLIKTETFENGLINLYYHNISAL